MNKILMDGDKLYYNGDIDKIEVDGYATIFIKDILNYKLDITVKKSSTLNIYIFASKNSDSTLNINQESESNVTLVHTFKIDGEYNFKYRANISGNKNINNVLISGVSNGNVSLDVDGIVSKKTESNELNENIKVLTINGKCFVAPKLHVSALDVLANHNTAISNVREDELFYLFSKGIDKKHAISLIEDSYVYGYLKSSSNEFLDYVIKE